MPAIKSKKDAGGAEAGARTPNRAVNADWRPTCLYLYYLIPTSVDHADIEVFVNESSVRLDDNNIDDFIKSTIVKIKNGDLHAVGWSFRDLAWRRISYIAVIADHARFILDHSGGVKFKKNGNHAEYTFKDLQPVSGLDANLTGVRCINHMLDDEGDRLGEHDRETFKVKLKFKTRQGFNDPGPRTHDDSGTNLGPPHPPPP